MHYFLLCLLLSITTACTSMRTIEAPDPEVAVSELEVGDTVQIVRTDGSEVRFKITAIDEDALVGRDDLRVLKSEIKTVSVKRIDAGRTAMAGVGTYAVIALISFAVVAATF